MARRTTEDTNEKLQSQENRNDGKNETCEMEAAEMLVLEMMPMGEKWRKGRDDGPDLIIRYRSLMN